MKLKLKLIKKDFAFWGVSFISNTIGNEYQMVDLDQKRELLKTNETITPLAFTVTTNMFRFV